MKMPSALARLGFVVSAISLALVAACDDEIGVTYINETDNTVIVIEREVEMSRIGPRSSKRVCMFRRNWTPEFKAVTLDGRILFEGTISLDDLKRMKYRIVFREPPVDSAGN